MNLAVSAILLLKVMSYPAPDADCLSLLRCPTQPQPVHCVGNNPTLFGLPGVLIVADLTRDKSNFNVPPGGIAVAGPAFASTTPETRRKPS